MPFKTIKETPGNQRTTDNLKCLLSGTYVMVNYHAMLSQYPSFYREV